MHSRHQRSVDPKTTVLTAEAEADPLNPLRHQPLTLTILLERKLQESSSQKRFHLLERLLFLGIRASGPFLQIERNRSMQETDGITVEIELKAGALIAHPAIFTPRSDQATCAGVRSKIGLTGRGFNKRARSAEPAAAKSA